MNDSEDDLMKSIREYTHKSKNAKFEFDGSKREDSANYAIGKAEKVELDRANLASWPALPRYLAHDLMHNGIDPKKAISAVFRAWNRSQ